MIQLLEIVVQPNQSNITRVQNRKIKPPSIYPVIGNYYPVKIRFSKWKQSVGRKKFFTPPFFPLIISHTHTHTHTGRIERVISRLSCQLTSYNPHFYIPPSLHLIESRGKI